MKLIDRDVNIPLREIVKKLTFRFIFFESFVYNIQTIIQINSYFIKEEPIMVNFDQWNGFKGRLWKEEINVRDFVQNNYKPYDGDESFLEGPTEATNKLWGRLQELQKEERAKGGVHPVDHVYQCPYVNAIPPFWSRVYSGISPLKRK